MKASVVLFFLAAYAVSDAVASSLNRGENSHVYGIKGGKKTHIDQHPYVVSVSTNKHRLLGSGVLLKNRWILTAALDFDRILPSDLIVRVGSDNAHKGGEEIQVDHIAIHPKYKGSWPYSLALIKLVKSVKVSKEVKTISLADELPQEGETTVVSGYGNTRYTTDPSDGWLREAEVYYVAYDNCKKLYSKAQGFTSASFCATKQGAGACPFDWGAPLVHKNKLVGVFQGSDRDCGSVKYPGVFADLPQVKDWIEDTIGH